MGVGERWIIKNGNTWYWGPYGMSPHHWGERVGAKSYTSRSEAFFDMANASIVAPVPGMRLVRVFKRVRAISREVIEGLAEVTDRSFERRWPTRIVLDRGGGQCGSIYDTFLKANEGKRVRVTFEVLP